MKLIHPETLEKYGRSQKTVKSNHQDICSIHIFPLLDRPSNVSPELLNNA
jgi:hypothetical protein